MSVKVWILIIGLCGGGLVIGIGLWLAPPLVEKQRNTLSSKPPYPVPEAVKVLHQQLFVADLHADSLLWNRNLLKRHDYGHLDIPRALDGNIALQIFGVVTKSPKGQNYAINRADSDSLTALCIVQAWPPRTWNSLLQRALYQAEKLHRLAAQSQGQVMLVQSVEDLEKLLALRQSGERVIGAFVGLEGLHALEEKLDNINLLYDAGFRMIGLVHFFDNAVGGSAHGVEKGGLTPFGKEVVAAIQAKKLIIDLAHASPQVIDDVLAMTTAPVIVSHTGVRGTCDNQRNLSDKHIRGIAATGGVIGIGMFDLAVCGQSITDTVNAMKYVADLVGVDTVAVGSDFDGTTHPPFDASGMALLTEALLKQGFSSSDIAKIMGKNVLRVLRSTLP